jgi:hypothetical protein
MDWQKQLSRPVWERERSAIFLAKEVAADLTLMDDGRVGV